MNLSLSHIPLEGPFRYEMTPDTLICHVCHESRIPTPRGATPLTRFTCRMCYSAIGRRRHIMECRSDAEKRREHLARRLEANRLRRERNRDHFATVCKSQNERASVDVQQF